jgi:hypothetical protein
MSLVTGMQAAVIRRSMWYRFPALFRCTQLFSYPHEKKSGDLVAIPISSSSHQWPGKCRSNYSSVTCRLSSLKRKIFVGKPWSVINLLNAHRQNRNLLSELFSVSSCSHCNNHSFSTRGRFLFSPHLSHFACDWVMCRYTLQTVPKWRF